MWNLAWQPKQTLLLVQEAWWHLFWAEVMVGKHFASLGRAGATGWIWIWSNQQHSVQCFGFHWNISPSKTAPTQCTYVLRCDAVTVQCSMASGSESCNCFSCEVEVCIMHMVSVTGVLFIKSILILYHYVLSRPGRTYALNCNPEV